MRVTLLLPKVGACSHPWRFFMSTIEGAVGGSNGAHEFGPRDWGDGSGIHRFLADRPSHPRFQDLAAQIRLSWRSADRRPGKVARSARRNVRSDAREPMARPARLLLGLDRQFGV